jgi:hypothetical protein
MPFNKPGNVSGNGMTAPLYPAVVDIMGYLNRDVRIRPFEIHVFQILFNVIVQCFLVAFKRKHIVAAPLHYLVRDFILAPHGVNRNNGPFEGYQTQNFGYRRYFSALFIRFNLRQPHAVFRSIHAYDALLSNT